MSRILIVENSPSVALTEAYLLGNAGYDVYRAATAGEALSFVEHTEADLIVLDSELPDMNGLALLDTLRERGVVLPAIMVSGRQDQRFVVKAMQNGVCDYVVKSPGAAASLSVAVERALGRVLLDRQAARELAERLEAAETRCALLDACTEAAVLFDASGTVLAVNAAAERLLGMAVGRPGDPEVLGFTAQVESPRGQPPISRLRKRGLPVSFDVHRDGRTLACTLCPLPQAGEDPQRAALVCRDVTRAQRSRRRLERGKARLSKTLERSRAQQQSQAVQEANLRLLGTLTGGIAHELSNLLMPALGFVELLQQRIGADHPEYGTVGRIHHALGLVRALVSNVLTLARPGRSRRVPMDLVQLVAEMLPLVRAAIRSDVQVHERLDRSPGPIQGNPVGLRSVVMNLCLNAGQAMPGGGRLELAVDSVRVDRESARRLRLNEGLHAGLVVRDTGVGMSKETLKRIFEPFFTTKGQGTGLGLHLVQGIVAEHGGAISVVSEPGQGATFTVLFPLMHKPGGC